MKKALLIIFVLSIISLAGCGIFNLGGWVWPEDDLEFMAVVGELYTPRDISDYMMENFEYELNNLWTPSPYILWETKKGDCNDFATFGMFVADYHGYETYLIKIFYKGTFEKHCIAVYVEEELSFTDNKLYHYGFGSFRGIVEFDCGYYFWYEELRKYIVKDYENNIVEVGYNPVH